MPPALQGVDTLLTAAGAQLVGVKDDWTGGLDDEDEDQVLDAADGLQHALAELLAAGPALESVGACFQR